MYFDQLLANGRLDKEAAKELSKKYHMSDENYSQLSPPTLSSTKLHMIQSYDVGGVYNRLLTIHTHHRSALKIFLHVIKMSLGGACQTSLGPHIFTITPRLVWEVLARLVW